MFRVLFCDLFLGKVKFYVETNGSPQVLLLSQKLLCALQMNRSNGTSVVEHTGCKLTTVEKLLNCSFFSCHLKMDYTGHTIGELGDLKDFLVGLLKVIIFGNSLVVQWLGLCGPVQMAWVRSLVRELKSFSLVAWPKKRKK